MSDFSFGVADDGARNGSLADVFLVAVRVVKTGNVEMLTRLLRERADVLADLRSTVCDGHATTSLSYRNESRPEGSSPRFERTGRRIDP
jgi:hypothetical protein